MNHTDPGFLRSWFDHFVIVYVCVCVCVCVCVFGTLCDYWALRLRDHIM